MKFHALQLASFSSDRKGQQQASVSLVGRTLDSPYMI